MNDLLIGVNGVVACEDKPEQVDDGWVFVITHTYYTEMMLWCGRRGLTWGTDMDIQTYRLENNTQNSHRWYFKDPEVATLFSLRFS